MRVTTFAAAAAFAVHASSFLVPIEIADAVEKATDEVNSVFSTSQRKLELDCPECWSSAVVPKDAAVGAANADAKLAVAFTLDESRQVLSINGAPVWPSIAISDISISSDITFSQSDTETSSTSTVSDLSFALEILPTISFHSGGIALTNLHFTILALNGQPKHIDTVNLSVIKTPDGNLHIAKTEVIPFASTPGAQECQTSLCRVKAILAHRIKSMLEAAKNRANKAGSWVKSGCGGRFGHVAHGQPGFRPGMPGAENVDGGFPTRGIMRHPWKGHGSGWGHRQHHGDKHRSHGQKIAHVLHQTLRFFIIPAMLGVIGGLMASAVGMLVGQMIVFTWMRFFRRNRGRTARLTELAMADDEKDVLIVEAPPMYEETKDIVLVRRDD